MFSKFATSNLFSSYVIDQTSTVSVGPWKIHPARRKNGSGALYSVFLFDKKSLDLPLQKSSRSLHAPVFARLKQEAQALAKLRHPSILELVEALEESKSQIGFITECVTNSLNDAVRRNGGENKNLDELEIQKGLLTVAKGLEFLGDIGGLVVRNLNLHSIVLNAKGDWKICGLGFAVYLRDDVKDLESLSYDPRLPKSVQSDLDFVAPDLILDSNLSPQNDMFSLGCLAIAMYSGHSPLNCNGNVSTYRQQVSSLDVSRFRQIPSYLKEVLPSLLSRRPPRMSATAFQGSKYFDNVLINTISFLEDFPAKPVGEKLSFMKGLPKVLPQFPLPVMQQKMLPGLLEQCKDIDLLPAILPNVFFIGQTLSTQGFSARCLPSLKPIFVLRESPGATSVCLDHLSTIMQKTTAREFKEDCLPLIFTAFELSHLLQERALGVVPEILKVMDLPTVKSELFPRIATVFTATTSLTIKCTTLKCFRSLTDVLDKFILTEKLVPLLIGMKTKEPDVTMAALDVYTGLLAVLDIQTLATQILSHVWALSLSPLLRLEQFRKFQKFITDASQRIITEHEKKLKQIDPPTTRAQQHEEVDFEKLVISKKSATNLKFACNSQDLSNPRFATAVADSIDDWDAWATPSITPDPPNSFATARVIQPSLQPTNVRSTEKNGIWARSEAMQTSNNRYGQSSSVVSPQPQYQWPKVIQPPTSPPTSSSNTHRGDANSNGSGLDKYTSLL